MLKIISSRAVSSFFLMTLFALLGACGGGGSGTSTSPTTPVTPVPTAAAVSLGASSASVLSDNSTASTVTATVVDASNAAVSGVTVAFSADSGFLSASSVVSDATGKAVVTFSSGNVATTRTATIVATASGKTSQLPIRITGSTLTLTSTNSALTVGVSTATLSVVAKNSGGTVLPGQAITFTQSGTGTVSFGAASGTTDSTGTFATTITPVTGGSVTVTATGVGETRLTTFTVTGTQASAFRITSPASAANLAGNVGTPLTVSVLAPSSTTRVTFASTLGTWGTSSSSVFTVAPVGGVASAQLAVSSSGIATIEVFDSDRQASTNDSRTVTFTAACTNPDRVTVQSSPSVVATSLSGTTNLANLIATVTSAGNPVGNCPVAFSIVNGTATGGGETISPPVVLTAATTGSGVGLGQASTIFAAGSLPSGAPGVQVRATVVGSATTVSTGTQATPDATVVIGGVSGSVTIGQSSVIQDTANSTTYVLPMSVLVADSNGNAVAGATVSLSNWPVAFNVGGAICAGSTNNVPNQPGIFYVNEDINENLIRDINNGESTPGQRLVYFTGSPGPSARTITGPLTPPNSAGGTLPATVTTGPNGVATFNLTYLKSNAGYIVDRIRARTLVQGTETIGEVRFQLGVLATDVGSPCSLAPSPFS